MNKILLGIVCFLLLVMLGFSGWWGWEQHKALQVEKDRAVELATEYQDSAQSWMDESFKLDETNTAIRRELEQTIQGNPNLEIYLMSHVPDDAIGWVWDFYESQYGKEDFPSSYVPRTRKEAVSLGLDNRQVFFTMFETAEALDRCNLKIKGTREFFIP